MGEMDADLVVLKFDDTYGAQRAMGAVAALQEMDYAWIEDVSVIERHRSGRIATHNTHGTVTGGTALGGLTGMFVGLLFPPAGFVGLMLAGMGAGALWSKWAKDRGVDEDLRPIMTDIRESLEKGTSALVLIGTSADTDQMARAFASHEPSEVKHHDLPHRVTTQLHDAVENAEKEAEQADDS